MAIADRIEIDFEGALATSNPVANLRDAVVFVLNERGADRDDLLAALDNERITLRDAGRVDDADAVIEVMERLVGHSSRRARI